jgi:alkaline phosphatase
LHRALHSPPQGGVAKNVVLVVGDGMSLATVTAARILRGQQLGMSGEEHQLAFEKFPHLALAKVSCLNGVLQIENFQNLYCFTESKLSVIFLDCW